MEKKVGIVCDNYKVTKFKEELDSKGFTYTVIPSAKLIEDTSSIIIQTEEENIPKIKTICEEVELHFKGLKN